MPDPRCAGTTPYVLELEPGDYFWCACGRSRNQPFCDGSHAGTDITPLMFTVTEQRKRGYCACKQTATPPYCDGSHKGLQP
ncbi:MAG: CDGSH iron-sulfur domain-containing protein [Gammaproteobacteria bacterium]|nr:CDGSH iron-sulfur domain-containing protein [Gammaproteobacteria bacterium]